MHADGVEQRASLAGRQGLLLTVPGTGDDRVQHHFPPQRAGSIARGVVHSIDLDGRPGYVRPTDVLETEKLITDFAGPDATLIHTGRSRQDMHPTLTLDPLRV